MRDPPREDRSSKERPRLPARPGVLPWRIWLVAVRGSASDPFSRGARTLHHLQMRASGCQLARHLFGEIEDDAPALTVFDAKKGPHQPQPFAYAFAFRLLRHVSLYCIATRL